MKKPKHKSPLRTLAKAGLAVGTSVALVHAVHAATLDRRVVYTEVPFYSNRVPKELDGYTIALVTDTHDISKKRLQGVVDTLNTRQVDLLLLGGDYAESEQKLQNTMALLSQVATTDGTFGVAGNHDAEEALFPIMETHNITPLANSGVSLRDRFYLAGVEDQRRRTSDIQQATAGATADSFVLLLSHQPDVSMRQNTVHIDLMLCGHTHGGHVTLFGLWTPALPFATRYGRRFAAGWATSRDGVPVFVSRGVGESLPRVFARPQVVLIRLCCQ
ncbi:MAG: metallophosphoesterase [Oscillospiraceae bacterium]|nr:metallophosphoesterase [Oscillospiraceae bacterium]